MHGRGQFHTHARKEPRCCSRTVPRPVWKAKLQAPDDLQLRGPVPRRDASRRRLRPHARSPAYTTTPSSGPAPSRTAARVGPACFPGPAPHALPAQRNPGPAPLRTLPLCGSGPQRRSSGPSPRHPPGPATHFPKVLSPLWVAPAGRADSLKDSRTEADLGRQSRGLDGARHSRRRRQRPGPEGPARGAGPEPARRGTRARRREHACAEGARALVRPFAPGALAPTPRSPPGTALSQSSRVPRPRVGTSSVGLGV